jgi:hypothetical protein
VAQDQTIHSSALNLIDIKYLEEWWVVLLKYNGFGLEMINVTDFSPAGCHECLKFVPYA